MAVEEAIAALSGEGPADLMTVTDALGAELLCAAGVAADVPPSAELGPNASEPRKWV